MGINFRSLFGLRYSKKKEVEEIDYDKYVNFYHKNLINSLVLFSLTSDELDKLAQPIFDPLFELESEIDYAFLPLMFETVFRNGRIDDSLKDELLAFKRETDNIPREIWNWKCVDAHPTWVHVRKWANELLDKLGVQSRVYDDDYLTVYDCDGNIVKLGKPLKRGN